jgi:hypothetical protein
MFTGLLRKVEWRTLSPEGLRGSRTSRRRSRSSIRRRVIGNAERGVAELFLSRCGRRDEAQAEQD